MKKSETLMEVERLEKEGKIREMIPKWEKESRELEEKKKKFEWGSEEYWKISLPQADIESKLYWSRLTPEQREREIKFWEDHNKKEEKINKEIKAVESKLNAKKIELRNQIIKFNNYCSCNKTIHADNQNEAKKLKDEAKKDSTKMLKEILKEVNKDINEVKPLLREEEWKEFEWLCGNYREIGNPIMFYTFIVPRSTKEEIGEARRKQQTPSPA